VHKVEIFEIEYGSSWKSIRRRYMRKGEEVEMHLPKTRGMIYMP